MRNEWSIIKLTAIIIMSIATNSFAQQDPQYTHYMYNTLSVNPAYAGQRETLSIVGLYRTQWVNINGAPQTQSLAIHSPLYDDRVGVGLNIVNDELGPSTETYVDANFSYTIPLNENDLKLSFGIKAGIHVLKTDWSRGRFQDPDVVFNQNLSLTLPLFGAGLYIHTRKWYLGLAAPNVVTTSHYDDFSESMATERLHLFLIAGYVFQLNETIKFKPAFLTKGVYGAPIIADISANFLFREKFTFGLAWRLSDSVSGLIGLQATPALYVGYGYDLTTTDLSNYNSGTHEVILRLEIQKIGRMLSPRFF